VESLWLIFFLQAIVFGGFSSFIANEKNRDPLSWFFLGFVFSLIAVLALIAVPKLEDNSKVGSKDIETKMSSTGSPMHEGGQTVINFIKKFLLGGENRE
jgi:hypothetical protein